MRVRKYLSFVQYEENQECYEEEQQLLNKLSDQLKSEVTTQQNLQNLKNCSIFIKNFSEACIQQMILIIKYAKFTPGENIFKQNDVDDNSIYFITKGEVEIITEFKRRNEAPQIIKRYGNKEYFGALEFFTSKKRQYTIKCISLCTVFKIRQQDFLEIIKNLPEDYETFCYIKDKLLLSNNINLENYMPLKNCFSCYGLDHVIEQCPFITYQPNKQVLIKKYYQSVPHLEREHFPRTIYRSHQTLYSKNNLKQAVMLYRQLRLPDYSSSSEDSDCSRDDTGSQATSLDSQQGSPLLPLPQQYQSQIIQQNQIGVEQQQHRLSLSNQKLNNNQNNQLDFIEEEDNFHQLSGSDENTEKLSNSVPNHHDINPHEFSPIQQEEKSTIKHKRKKEYTYQDSTSSRKEEYYNRNQSNSITPPLMPQMRLSNFSPTKIKRQDIFSKTIITTQQQEQLKKLIARQSEIDSNFEQFQKNLYERRQTRFSQLHNSLQFNNQNPSQGSLVKSRKSTRKITDQGFNRKSFVINEPQNFEEILKILKTNKAARDFKQQKTIKFQMLKFNQELQKILTETKKTSPVIFTFEESLFDNQKPNQIQNQQTSAQLSQTFIHRSHGKTNSRKDYKNQFFDLKNQAITIFSSVFNSPTSQITQENKFQVQKILRLLFDNMSQMVIEQENRTQIQQQQQQQPSAQTIVHKSPVQRVNQLMDTQQMQQLKELIQDHETIHELYLEIDKQKVFINYFPEHNLENFLIRYRHYQSQLISKTTCKLNVLLNIKKQIGRKKTKIQYEKLQRLKQDVMNQQENINKQSFDMQESSSSNLPKVVISPLFKDKTVQITSSPKRSPVKRQLSDEIPSQIQNNDSIDIYLSNRQPLFKLQPLEHNKKFQQKNL